MSGNDIERLVQQFAKLPGLGPRSARRVVLYLIKRRETLMMPLAQVLRDVSATMKNCSQCGNIDVTDPCAICTDTRRDLTVICAVEDVAGLWALERAVAFTGRYHVLGGTLSALDGRKPEDLAIASLVARAESDDVNEVVLAMSATVEGQTTAYYLADRLAQCGVKLSRLAHGVPVGGELDYLDDGTLSTAIKARHKL